MTPALMLDLLRVVDKLLVGLKNEKRRQKSI